MKMRRWHKAVFAGIVLAIPAAVAIPNGLCIPMWRANEFMR